MQPNSILALSPSFSSYSSNQFAEIASKVIREICLQDEEEEEEEEEDHQNPNNSDPLQQSSVEGDDAAGGDTNAESEDDDGDDFEFTFVRQDPDESTITAEDIFSNGQIRPIFPIFNRDLIVEENDDSKVKNRSTSIRLPLRKLLIDGRDPSPVSSSSSASTSSSESDTINGINGTFCIWTPKSMAPATPDRCKKSNSTGTSKRWRFRDLLHRSSSDGKDTYVFLSTAAMKRGETTEGLKDKTSSSLLSGKGKGASAAEMHYVRNRAIKEGDRRRSYLPYRQDLVGFFANVNGLGKSFHPF